MNKENWFSWSKLQNYICLSFDLSVTLGSQWCSFWSTSWSLAACFGFLAWWFLFTSVRFAFVAVVWRRWQNFEETVQSTLCGCCTCFHDLLATRSNTFLIELPIAAQIFHQTFLIGVFPLQLLQIKWQKCEFTMWKNYNLDVKWLPS